MNLTRARAYAFGLAVLLGAGPAYARTPDPLTGSSASASARLDAEIRPGPTAFALPADIATVVAEGDAVSRKQGIFAPRPAPAPAPLVPAATDTAVPAAAVGSIPILSVNAGVATVLGSATPRPRTVGGWSVLN